MSIVRVSPLKAFILAAAIACVCLADVNTSDLSEDVYWLDLFGESWLMTGTNRSGDFNGDGIVNFKDYAIILKTEDADYIRNYFYLQDIALRKRNCQKMLKLAGRPCQNVDLPQEAAGLMQLSTYWLSTERNYAGDFNEDGIVNFKDYAYMLQTGYPLYK